MNELKEYYLFIISNHFLKSASIVLLSVIFAKMVDVVFTIIFKRMVDKTKTKLYNILFLIPLLGFCITLKTYFLSYILLGLVIFFFNTT